MTLSPWTAFRALLACFAACAAFNGQASADSVTVAEGVRSSIIVRARPSPTAKPVSRLGREDVAELVATHGRWRQIRLASGRLGYVSTRDTVVMIEPKAQPATDLTVTFVDVENGDAILMKLGDVELLVDAGKSSAWDLGLGQALDDVKEPLETLFITHPHLDHYGGAAAVLEKLVVARVVTNGERRGPPRDREEQKTWSYFEQAVKDEGLHLESLAVGDRLTPAQGLSIDVLATGDPQGGRYPDSSVGTDINNDSLVLMVTYGGRRLLLTGDIEVAAGEALVQAYCSNGDPTACPRLHADVLKVPHHGSAHFAMDLFRAVSPGWAVMSAANGSTALCLPRAESSDALHSLGARVVSTSAEGTAPAVLTISAAGDLRWTLPAKPVFVWKKAMARGAGSKCGAPVLFAQGE